MLVNSFVWSVLLASAGFASASDPKQIAKEDPKPNVITSQGCFSSTGNMTETKLLSEYKDAGVSSGNCRDTCQTKGFYVMALATQKCYCGRLYPPEADLVKDKFCSFTCQGTGAEVCGGLGGYSSVFNLGVEVDVGNYEPESTSSTSSAASEKTSSVEKEKTSAPASEATNTDSASSAPSSGEGNDDDGDSGPSIGAIVGGVVGGVVVLGALIGAMVFFMRRRRNAEIEEEHRRNAAVNAFINGAKPPGSSGSISMTDSRLDPVMAHRRLSDGSIADNQDYSRRILRVTNA